MKIKLIDSIVNFNTTVEYEKSLFTQAFFYVYLFENEIKMKF